MNDVRQLLPSSKFISSVLSLLVALGIVATAYYVTAPKDAGTSLASTEQPVDKDWQATLYAIQGNNASSSLPTPPTEEQVAQQLASARTSNLTETVSRSLAINLANAKQQGLGDDSVSQEKAIADALAQENSAKTPTHSIYDLRIVDDSPDTLHAYGNAVVAVIEKHPSANARDYLQAIASAVDTGSSKQLGQLTVASTEYKGLVDDLLVTPVPRSLSSFHLILINDFLKSSNALLDAQTLISDPLRGLSGVQQLAALLSEESRMFINIANQFQKRSILFSKDEPGAAWGVLLNISPATSQS